MSLKFLEDLKRDIVESQVWKAIFRHGYDDTPRNRVLMVTANVFLHLHPAKVRRHGVRMRFTWCMGGLTFFMFLITVVVPKFREILMALGGELPLMTQSVLLLGQYAWIVGAVILTAIAVFRMNRGVQAWCRRRAPWSGRLFRSVSAGTAS